MYMYKIQKKENNENRIVSSAFHISLSFIKYCFLLYSSHQGISKAQNYT
jgi:hypothetical protein